MNIPEENLKTGQQGRKSGIILFLLLVIVIIGIAAAVFLKSEGIELEGVNIKEFLSANTLSEKNTPVEKKAFEMNYDSRERPAFIIYKDMLIKCGSDTLKGINRKGEEIWTRNITADNPMLKTNGSDLLIADLGGNEINVLSGKDAKWSQKISGSIINAEISETGHVTVIYEAKSYRSIVKVFDPRGIEMFSRNIAQNYVLTAKISPSAEQILVNSIDVSGMNIKPSLEFFDMMGSPFAARVPDPGTIFPSVFYLADDSLVAVGKSLMLYYDRDRNEKWRKEFEGVDSCVVSLGKYIAAAVRVRENKNTSQGSSMQVEIINARGHQAAVYPVDSRVENIQAYSDIIAVNTVREIHFINTKGTLVGKYSSKTDIKGVYFFNKLEAAVVTKNSVAVIRIN